MLPAERGNDWFRDYVDDVVIRIEFVDGIPPTPTQVWELRLEGPGAPSQAQILAEVEWLVSNEASALFQQPYSLRLQRDVTSWGADGAGEQIVLQLAEWAAEGTVGAASLAALRAFLRRITGMVDNDAAGLIEQPPLGREQALAQGEWTVRERFGLPPETTWLDDNTEVRDESLRLIGEEHEAGVFTFTWDRHGTRFQARIEEADGMVQVSRVSRLDDR